MKEVIDVMKEGFGEQMVIENFLDLCNFKRTLNVIGDNSDIESEFKNEFFDGIYEDENGIILDVRLTDNKPSKEELDNYAEYWRELSEKFGKLVSPVFIVRNMDE